MHTRSILAGTFALLAFLIVNATAAPEPDLPPTLELPLWDAGEHPVPSTEVPAAGGRVSHVNIPTLTAYLPDPASATGTALVICSGGGYDHLASGPIGKLAAQRFLHEGVAVFSLKYRLKPPSSDVLHDAVEDGRQAVRLVRSHAVEWRLDPAKVGMVGWSAGANLILNLACHADAGNPDAADATARQGCRPNFIGLLSPWPYRQKIADFAIPADGPPAFVGSARDDTTAPFSFAEDIVTAWKAAGLPVEFLAVDQGNHAAFALSNGAHREWPDTFLPWLERIGMWSPK